MNGIPLVSVLFPLIVLLQVSVDKRLAIQHQA